MDTNVDESLIEATIRRVAEAQAARDGTGDSGPVSEHGDLNEAPVPSSDAADLADAMDAAPAGPRDEAPGAQVRTQPTAVTMANESEIEATIRRVAAATAKRAETTESAPSAALEEAPHLASSRALEPPLTFAQRGHNATALAFEPEVEPEPSAAALARIEQSLDAVHVLLRQITERLDSTGAAMGGASASAASPVLNNVQDDDWEDEAPPLPAMAFGAPRPSILRDPPARVPEPAVVDEIDTPRPLAPLPQIQPDTRRGFDLLPRTYRITVEDKRRGVDLVPLHRALLAMDGVRDMSLLSYNNGVAIVSLETVSDIDTDVLRQAVSRAMSRPATVETHNERTLVVKLAED